ncbi:hypothetical protein KY290_033717 [Solanum tuberosum]|uniref:Uncharacterized protein n=1 Tax=Solanum tuberosum TaxID=4113 RepID=A0ABQ7U306_SOLTU|nr:hypothetical protein KY290_033717 [Solanum tuberosum]
MTKALDTSHGPVLSAQERQVRDDSVMARMFGMADLQLRIGGHPTGRAFLEPLDNNEASADGAMDDDEE